MACALSPFFHVSGLVNEREMEGWYQLHNFKSNNSDWERKFLSGSVQIICGIVMVIWKEPGRSNWQRHQLLHSLIVTSNSALITNKHIKPVTNQNCVVPETILSLQPTSKEIGDSGEVGGPGNSRDEVMHFRP